MVVAMCADDLTEYVRATFALDAAAPAALMPGARGALGQISRLEIGSRRYAVKELFDDEAPAAALIAAEVEFTALAAAAGVRVAASHRAWAVRESDEALRILPTPTVFAQLIEVDAALG